MMKVGTNASCIIIFGYFKDSMNDIYLYIYLDRHYITLD
jgi:hypothetical protein